MFFVYNFLWISLILEKNMNMKSLCLLGLAGAICVSTGIASGLTDYNNNVPNVNSGYSFPYNISAIQNVPNQIGQNAQQRTGNISTRNQHEKNMFNAKIACIKEMIKLSREMQKWQLTMPESKNRLLEMIPGIVMLTSAGGSQELRKEFLIQSTKNRYRYAANMRSFTSTFLAGLNIESLLTNLEKICVCAEWARTYCIPKQCLYWQLVFLRKSISIGSKNQILELNMLSWYRNCLLESY